MEIKEIRKMIKDLKAEIEGAEFIEDVSFAEEMGFCNDLKNLKGTIENYIRDVKGMFEEFLE